MQKMHMGKFLKSLFLTDLKKNTSWFFLLLKSFAGQQCGESD